MFQLLRERAALIESIDLVKKNQRFYSPIYFPF